MKRRQMLRQLQLPSDVVDALAKLALCDCGRPARHIGVFFVTTTSGQVRQDAMLLCEACAQDVDRGVKVVPLEQ